MSVEVISLAAKHAEFSETWSPHRVAALDGHAVKLVKAVGAFDWHAHPDADELFFVSRGILKIEIEDQDPVIIGPGELCVIPKGVRHRPIARTDTVHLMLIEQAGVVNTGDNETSDKTAAVRDL